MLKKQVLRIWRYLYSADIGEAEYRRIQPQILQYDRRSLEVYSGVATFFLLIMVGISYLVGSISEGRVLYMCCAGGTAIVHLVSIFRAKKHPEITIPMLYLFLFVLMFFGIVLGTMDGPDELTVSFIALLLVAPSLFVDRPIRMCGLIIASMLCFVPMGYYFKETSSFVVDLVDVFVFGFLSMITSSFNIQSKVKRFWLEEELRFMGETDQLTGLKNRNCYELSLGRYMTRLIANVSCVYVDVNGLHELNDTYGHEAGDRMLQMIAGALQEQFGVMDAYRIGGDEYVAFAVNETEQQVLNKVSVFLEKVEAEGYHVAVGVEHAAVGEVGINQVIQRAEAKMYAAKQAYYTASGKERRRR